MTHIQLLAQLEDLGVRLQVKDNNLKISAPKGALTPHLVDELKDKKEEIIEFLNKKIRQQETYALIPPALEKEYYPLSSGQRRLFVLQQMVPDSTGYNIPLALMLEGDLDKGKLENVFLQLIQRHESLRTSFETVEDEPVQKVHKDVAFEIEYHVAKNMEHASIIKNFVRAFDLSRPPLLRVGLINTGNNKHVFMVDMHHIISDGTSTGILVTEFMALYEGKKLPELKVQYKDFAVWENRQREGEALKPQEAFWLGDFDEEIPVLDLPYDFLRPVVQSFEGTLLSFDIDSKNTRALNDLALEEGTTLFVVLLSVYNIFLSKISNQEVVVIGTPAADRPHAVLQPVIGMFVNTLPLKNEPAGKKTVRAFLKEVREKTLKAFANQDYQYEELVEALKIERDASRNPLFDTMFAHQNLDIPEIEIPGLKLTSYPYERGIAKFDLMLVSGETDDYLSCLFEYCTRLFKEDTIKRFIGYFKKIVSAVVERPDGKIAAIEIVSVEEKDWLLYQFNRTGAEYPRHETVHQLFAQQVEKRPDSIAVHRTYRTYRTYITYDHLNRKSNQLARYLREQGIVTDSVVGLLVEPAVEMMIGMVGIMKAGAAYLPIDPKIPTGRVEYIVNDAALPVLLCHNASADKIAFNGHLVNLDEEVLFSSSGGSSSNPGYESLPRDLAYVIYTSGSTGRPKGVGVEHCQLVNFLYHMYNRYEGTVDAHDRCLSVTNIMFDVSVWEFFLPLVFGAQLVICPEEKRFDVFALTETILNEAITLIYLPPALLKEVSEELMKERSRLSLNKMLVGVEPILDEVLEAYMRLHPQMRIINGYGPTETTICCSSVNYTSHPPKGEIVPIGVPLSNNQIVLLTSGDHVVPQGIPGEVCVSGDGVSRGYLNNPELTAEKYTVHPYFAGKRMYRTGDLGRLLPEGNIRFMGRRDQQLKVRGYRIELGEIENRLLKHNHIKQALVLAKTNELAGKYLCAYIVSEKELEIPVLREYLLRDLPDYMIPSYFVPLEKIPLTPNGKVDRRALPEPDITARQEEYIAPRNAVERKLAELWGEVLEIDKDKISIDTDFFELGGHSLKATLLLSKINKAFDVKIPMTEIFTTPFIRGLADFIHVAAESKFLAIKTVEKKEYYPLSSAQKRLYILQQMEPAGTVYNLPVVSILEGDIDKERFEDTFRQLIHRHESLRTSFETIDNEPVQKVHDRVEFKIEYIATEDTEKDHFIRSFDLSRAPLLRVGLNQVAAREYLLIVDMHHIISDGTSMGVLVNEFMNLYEGKELSPLRVQYKDYAQWQNLGQEEETLRQQEAFWTKAFEGEIPVLNLPTDFPRPLVQSFEGNRITFELNGEETGNLNRIARAQDATLFMVLMAVYYTCLAKLSGQEEMVVGTVVAGRRHADLEGIIGMFVNTLALRNFPRGDKTFSRFLEDVKEQALKTFENQEYPFEELVEKISVTRDASRNPLFDVMFVLQNIADRKLNVPGLTLKPYETETWIAKFDLNMIASQVQDHLVFEVEYCTKLFKKETVERFAGFFKKIVSSILENPFLKINEIEIISPEEKELILNEFNATAAAYPAGSTIDQLFEEQVLKTPDRTAVVFEDEFLSYKELKNRADRLTSVLRLKGAKEDRAVGIMAKHSLEMIIGITAILNVGGGYLPINPDYPQPRKKYLLKDSDVGILVSEVSEVSEDIEVIDLKHFSTQPLTDSPAHPLTRSPAQLAYIIYTSGSTGIPKGVMVNHRNVVRLVKNTNFIQFRERERLLQTGALEFDASTLEIWGPLLNGLTLCLTKKENILSADRLKEILTKYDIALMWMTAPLFNQMLQTDIDIFSGLKHIYVGGDILSPVHINRLRRKFPGLKVSNGYGPTENTTFSTTFLIDSEYSANIPIGAPVANSTAYIVDKNNYLQPVGVPGELIVGGDGVSRGYLNDPELTAEKYNRSHRSYRSYKTHICYKTGDLARWLPDGNIEFLGRIDFQVKIRGFRVELGEIENRLLKHPSVQEAVVIARKSEKEEKYLVAYIVLSMQGTVEDISPSEAVARLREFLSRDVPDYMVPAFFVTLEKIPLNPNGKVDRKALPEPAVGERGEDYAAPGTAVEKQLVELWSDALGVEQGHIGIDTDFFELGGNSLRATAVSSNIHKVFNVKIPLTEIFVTPTIRGLSRYIEGAVREKYAAIEPVEKRDYYALSPAQNRLYLLHQMVPDCVVYNMPHAIPLQGETSKERLERTFKELIQRHDSLRTSFEMVGGDPVQRIHEHVDFEVSVVSGKGLLVEAIMEDFVRPFDLSRAPLLRVDLVESPGQDGIHLLLDMHHIITDGASQEILTDEFHRLYTGKESVETLSPLRLQYKDFSQWQNGEGQQALVKEQEAYWLRQFSGELPVLNLPIDYPRPFVQSFDGNVVEFLLNDMETRTLKSAAKQTNATLFMSILSLFNIFLSKLSGQEDIIVGTPIAGRRHADLEPIIGMFVNTLAMRNYPSGDKGFLEFLEEVKEQTLAAYENQEYQFEGLVDKIDVRRDTGRNPVFDVVFNLLSQDDYTGDILGIDEQADSLPYTYTHHKGTAKFDMTLITLDVGERLFFAFEYCSKLFAPATIERFITYFKRLLGLLSGDLNKKLSELSVITDAEKQQILYEFNDAEPQFPTAVTIHGLFEQQAEEKPDAVAIHRSNRTYRTYISYDQLNRSSNQLARYLSQQGTRANQLVGLLADRSLEMILGILGIWKAGGAYAPMNPKAPASRNGYILNECSADLLLTTRRLYKENEQPGKWGGEIIFFEDQGPAADDSMVQSAGNPSDLAYAIFTSGSTGKPKGVPITHSNLCPLLHWGYKHLGIGTKDRTIQNLSYYFDWSVWEIFITLTTGASLYMVPEELLLNPEVCFPFMTENDITVLHVTPTQYQHLIHAGHQFESLRYLFLGAEKLTVDLLKRSFASVSEACRVFNMYGPTEATIISGVLEIERGEESKFGPLTSVPIGEPVANAPLLILDKYMKLCPVKVTGELYIAGDGLSHGYLNDPGKTHGTFVSNPYESEGIIGDRLYKTGDLVRWLPDGNVEFLGRIDFQIKIRGFRIELGEIENRLLEHSGVKEAVVITKQRENADPFLVAYIVFGSDEEFKGMESSEQVSQLREHLSQRLPDYMVPSFFVPLAEIPLNPNGKVDRKALPEPEIAVSEEEYAPPTSAVEVTLAGLWSGVLGLDKEDIGIDADFFQLGGNSLKAARLNAHIHRAFNIKLALTEVFTTPTIRGLAKQIEGTVEEEYIALAPAEKREYYALSPAQKRLYLLHQMVPEIVVYNMPQVIPLEGEIDKEKLEGTFKELIKRHESLRTSFEVVGGEPVQRILEQVEFSMEHGALSIEGSDFVRPFDLSQAPLLRVGLIKTEDNAVALLIDMHHIITDGTSQSVLLDEFNRLYGGEGEELPPLRLQYKDYSQWQNSEAQQAFIKQQEGYWLKQFRDELPVINLPIDYPRPFVQSFEGNTVEFPLSVHESQTIKAVAKETNATLFMSMLAVCNILLSKLSGQEDIIVGITVAGRRHADLQMIIGMFVNMLAIRNHPSGERGFLSFLEEVKEVTLAAHENQEYPFEELVEKLDVIRDTGRSPVFDVVLNFLSLEEYVDKANIEDIKDIFALDEESEGPYEHKKGTAKFDLVLNVVEIGERLLCAFEYCSKLFAPPTIERFIGYFKRILALLSEGPNRKLSELSIITDAEKRQILCEFNDAEPQYPADITTLRLFEQQAEKTPDGIAIHRTYRTYRTYITYDQLNRSSDQLARYLVQQGAGENQLVGLLAERSLEMIIGILGTWKSGGAYAPLNPKAPASRNGYILSECSADLLLTTRALFEEEEKLAGWDGDIHFIEECRENAVVPLSREAVTSPSDLAYAIFTSGSTGKPKGVPISHSNLCPLLHWGYKHLGIGPKDRAIQNLSYYFDWSVWEIFITLTTGASLYIVPEEMLLDPEVCIPFMAENDITVLHVTPSQYQGFIHAGHKLESLKYLFLGAEKLTVDLLKRSFASVSEACRVFNMYGPTEATIITGVLEIKRGEESKFETLTSVPIGEPVANAPLLVLDKYMKLCPLNVTGELYIAGDGVSHGYLNDPVKTQGVFISNPYEGEGVLGERLYKTGDLVRWLPDGHVEFFGREDFQVKIRGFRIELGEIENRLLEHGSVKEAVVISRQKEGAAPYLAAYIVLSSKGEYGEMAVSELISQCREFLSQGLPDYMVPSFFVPLDQMPLNPNGKVDRRALPEPDIGEEAEAYAAPGSALEMVLVELWSDVLGLEKERIGIDADFFQLGGDSLKSFFVTSKIKKALEVELSIPEFFSSPTIRGTASLIADKAPEKEYLFSRVADMAAVPGGALPDSDPAVFQEQVEAFIQQPLILFNPPTQHTQKNIFCFPPVLAFGLAYKVLASAIPDAAFYCFNFIEEEDRIRKYVELITAHQPVGPYILLGFSAGGKLTFETAAALESRGLEVSDIILIDSFWPGEDIAEEPQADTFQEIEDYLEELGVSFLKEKILSRVKNYWGYFSKKTPISVVNARLHLIVSEERRGSPLTGSWGLYTEQPPVVYQGFGRHADMIYAAGADKNAEIIRSAIKH